MYDGRRNFASVVSNGLASLDCQDGLDNNDRLTETRYFRDWSRPSGLFVEILRWNTGWETVPSARHGTAELDATEISPNAVSGEMIVRNNTRRFTKDSTWQVRPSSYVGTC